MSPGPILDFYASEPHFIDHLAPLYLALPPEHRGVFLTVEPERKRAAARGIPEIVTAWPEGANSVIVAAYGDMKRAKVAGRSRIAFIEHGIGQTYGSTHGSYPGGMGRDVVSLFLLPNEYSARHSREVYPDTPVAVVGCPKLDTLPPAPHNDPPVLAVGFHWLCQISPEAGSAFREYRDSLGALARRYTLLGHGHPRNWRMFEKNYRRMGIEPVADFHEVLRRADLYICDNSSSMYEFAATGRPVVVLNSVRYRRRVHHGLRFWEAATVGVQVDNANALLPAIELALTDGPEQRTARETALDIVYAYRTGATERAVQALLRWLAEVE